MSSSILRRMLVNMLHSRAWSCPVALVWKCDWWESNGGISHTYAGYYGLHENIHIFTEHVVSPHAHLSRKHVFAGMFVSHHCIECIHICNYIHISIIFQVSLFYAKNILCYICDVSLLFYVYDLYLIYYTLALSTFMQVLALTSTKNNPVDLNLPKQTRIKTNQKSGFALILW